MCMYCIFTSLWLRIGEDDLVNDNLQPKQDYTLADLLVKWCLSRLQIRTFSVHENFIIKIDVSFHQF